MSRRRLPVRSVLRLLGLIAAAALVHGLASAQQIHRNGFEALRPGWVKGGFDAPNEEKAHAITDQTAHDGRRSEYISLEAKPGTFIHYQYTTGKALVGEELGASVWLKANRPGIQLIARVVLPNERDPNNLENRVTTYLRGDTYQKVGQWQALAIGRPVLLAKQQQQLLQAQLKRSVNFDGAYVDALLLNVYAGPGPVEVWVDDLEIGPLSPDATFQPASRPSGTTPGELTSIRPQPKEKLPLVEFNGNSLTVGNKPFLFRAVRWSDTPLRTLRDAGFNTIVFDNEASDALLREAAELGLWVVPPVRVATEDGRPLSPEAITRQIARSAGNEGVLFHRLNGVLAFEQATLVSRAAQQIRQSDPGRPIAADVWDGLMPYSRSLNMLGVYRWPLMTTLELPQYREWLDLRRRLANPGAFMWTWVQTHMPEPTAQALYDRPAGGAFPEPIGPQAEQVRLVAYSALAAGCRGLAFWSDRYLADSHHGRDRLLTCALLNQELDMLEPLLVTVDDPPQWIETSVPEVKAAVMRCAKGVLVLPIWQGRFSQFVPGQAAVKQLAMIVPMVPQSTEAWEVTPGEVRRLKATREHGGMKITIPEFGLTSAVVFTSDTKDVVARFQEQARARRQLASQYTFDMAVYELDKAIKVQDQLEQMGHTLPDARMLLADAQKRLATAKQMWDSRLFAEAYRESERALRPVRILMRAQWEQAVRGLDSPVATPYSATFYTLPRHWQMMDQVKASVVGQNQLAGGDFEPAADRAPSWRKDERTLDEVELIADRVGVVKVGPGKEEAPKEGRQCAMLQVKPRAGNVRPQALERTVLALNSEPLRLQPGSLVQVSGWVRIPERITASPDGALFYDNAGDEALAVRLTEPTEWKKYTFFRRVPASGTFQVTLALTGVGTVYFDDVRIEPLLPANRATAFEPGLR